MAPRDPRGANLPRPSGAALALALATAASLQTGSALAQPAGAPPPAAAPGSAPETVPGSVPETVPGSAPETVPGSAPETVPDTESAPAPGSAPAPAPAPLEVTVSGERAAPASTSIRRRDIREMPGVLGDPYRAIEVQPGVTPTASGLPYYFIRGAPPGNIGYFFDGIRVPLLFHVGGGPSVIPAAVVRRVDFYPGPAPVDHGRFAGAIVAAEGTPPAYGWRGEGAVRAGDIGGVVEGPAGEDLDVMIGGHYAAGAALVSLLVPSVSLSYADYQARASLRTGPDERVSVLAFGSYDYLATIEEGETDTLLDSDFHRVDVRYEREDGEGGAAGAAVTLGLDRSRDVGVESATDWRAGARAWVARPLGDRVRVRAGVDVAVDRYEVKPRAGPCPGGCPPDAPEEDVTEAQLAHAFRVLFPSRVDLALGAWADATIAIDERSSIQPGLRIDHYRSLDAAAIAIDPRIVGRFGVTDEVRLVNAVGIASQLPGFAPLPALQIGGIPGGLQRSVQSSFGVELDLGPIQAVSSLFRQVTLELTDPIGTGRGTSFGPERFLTRSLGDAYGLELGARGALSRNMFFLASYTLSRATRRVGGEVLPSAYDRTHVAHAALLYDLGNGWRAGVRHVFYSGFPADESGPGHAPSAHPDRVRPFYRLDVRASKRWAFGERGWISLVLDLQNATLSKEVFDVDCEERGCTPRTLGPLTIPGLALEAGF